MSKKAFTAVVAILTAVIIALGVMLYLVNKNLSETVAANSELLAQLQAADTQTAADVAALQAADTQTAADVAALQAADTQTAADVVALQAADAQTAADVAALQAADTQTAADVAAVTGRVADLEATATDLDARVTGLEATATDLVVRVTELETVTSASLAHFKFVIPKDWVYIRSDVNTLGTVTAVCDVYRVGGTEIAIGEIDMSAIYAECASYITDEEILTVLSQLSEQLSSVMVNGNRIMYCTRVDEECGILLAMDRGWVLMVQTTPGNTEMITSFADSIALK